jgi:glucan phosphoethanolaminetransferase (alkaline phosphatase superfamily)
MLQNIAYFLIFGKPLIMYFGIIVLLSFLTTATIGALIVKGIGKIPFKFHKIMAGLSIILAIIHGILGILIYF